MPPNPPSKAHGFAMRSMSHRDMQISKSEKKISWPPLAKSWGRPWGPDGIPNEFYKMFSKELSAFLITFFKECFDKGTITFSQKISVVALIVVSLKG